MKMNQKGVFVMKKRINKQKKKFPMIKLLIIVAVLLSGYTFKDQLIEKVMPGGVGQEVAVSAESAKSFPKINSKQGILVNLKTKEVISQKKGNQVIYPASLTKIMTTLVALEQDQALDRSLTIPSGLMSDLHQEGAAVTGFFEGETVPVLDLLYGVMLPSGADAALTVAEGLAGSEEKFVALMNQKAQDLKLENTHFTNVTGLHDKKHQTTVADLSRLLASALENPQFRAIFTTKEHIFYNDYHPEGLVMPSRLFANLETSQLNQGEILGGKTGYTDEAGQCLASLAIIDGQEYILVTTGAKTKSDFANLHIEDAVSIYQNM